MYHGACHIEPFSDGHDGTSLKWSSVAISSSMEITSKHSLFVKSILSGLPWDAPCQRHPLIPSSAQTSTPNFDLFSLLFMVVTFKQMTIKHSMYIQKVPFLCTETACVVFSVLGFTLEEKLHGAKRCKFYGPEHV